MSIELLLLVARVQIYFGYYEKGDKWVLFSWLMITGSSRHGSRGGEGERMENLLRK